VAKVRERLAVSKQTMRRHHMERFNLKKLNEIESQEEYRVDFSNRFAVLEHLDTEVYINKTWKTIRENVSEFPAILIGKKICFPHDHKNDIFHVFQFQFQPSFNSRKK
jgi:hypothetical protein